MIKICVYPSGERVREKIPASPIKRIQRHIIQIIRVNKRVFIIRLIIANIDNIGEIVLILSRYNRTTTKHAMNGSIHSLGI